MSASDRKMDMDTLREVFIRTAQKAVEVAEERLDEAAKAKRLDKKHYQNYYGSSDYYENSVHCQTSEGITLEKQAIDMLDAAARAMTALARLEEASPQQGRLLKNKGNTL